MGLGRVEPQNEHEPFCMTVIGLKLSRRANAVSSLHGHVSRRMWAHLWPWRVEEEIPIGHITNGVHIPTWLAYPMHLLYDRVLRQRLAGVDGRRQGLAELVQRRSGRAVGNAQRSQEPAAGFRPPPRGPAELAAATSRMKSSKRPARCSTRTR